MDCTEQAVDTVVEFDAERFRAWLKTLTDEQIKFLAMWRGVR
jgi:hypothetical protein